jgi:hypothetical protein
MVSCLNFFIEVLDEIGLFTDKKVIFNEKKFVGLPAVWNLNLYRPDKNQSTDFVPLLDSSCLRSDSMLGVLA